MRRVKWQPAALRTSPARRQITDLGAAKRSFGAKRSARELDANVHLPRGSAEVRNETGDFSNNPNFAKRVRTWTRSSVWWLVGVAGTLLTVRSKLFCQRGASRRP